MAYNFRKFQRISSGIGFLIVAIAEIIVIIATVLAFIINPSKFIDNYASMLSPVALLSVFFLGWFVVLKFYSRR